VNVHRNRARTASQAALAVALAGLLPANADEPAAIDGYGRIDGRYCAAAARLVLDDGRHFEVDASFAPGATMDVRGATIEAPLCGRAPRLSGGIVAVPARPAIELTLAARDWPRHAADIDALARRFPQARLRVRVLAADTGEAQAAALHIGSQWLHQRPELMARSTIAPLTAGSAAREAVRGWRVVFDALDETRSMHADSAGDVARLLAAAR